MVSLVELRIEPLSTSSNFYLFPALGPLMCTTAPGASERLGNL